MLIVSHTDARRRPGVGVGPLRLRVQRRDAVHVHGHPHDHRDMCACAPAAPGLPRPICSHLVRDDSGALVGVQSTCSGQRSSSSDWTGCTSWARTSAPKASPSSRSSWCRRFSLGYPSTLWPRSTRCFPRCVLAHTARPAGGHSHSPARRGPMPMPGGPVHAGRVPVHPVGKKLCLRRRGGHRPVPADRLCRQLHLHHASLRRRCGSSGTRPRARSAAPALLTFVRDPASPLARPNLGYLFNLDDLWVGLAWLGEISYLSYGFKALSVNEFQGLKFNCPEYGTSRMSPCTAHGVQVLTHALCGARHFIFFRAVQRDVPDFDGRGGLGKPGPGDHQPGPADRPARGVHCLLSHASVPVAALRRSAPSQVAWQVEMAHRCTKNRREKPIDNCVARPPVCVARPPAPPAHPPAYMFCPPALHAHSSAYVCCTPARPAGSPTRPPSFVSRQSCSSQS